MLVTTGFPYSNGIHSEVIDIHNDDSTCTDLFDAPYEMEGGTGGFTENFWNYVLICGGSKSNGDDSSECWSAPLISSRMNVGQSRDTITMKYKRNHASSITIKSTDPRGYKVST